MNILIINTLFYGGGAEKTVRQLTKGLEKNGHKIFVVVYKYNGDKKNIVSLYGSGIYKMYNYIVTKWHDNENISLKHSYNIIAKIIKDKDIDIIHLHNVHGNYLGIKDICEIVNKGKPIVWTLHDAWTFTGHCAVPDNCNEWSTGCKECMYLKKTPAIRKDHTASLWQLKKKTFSGKGIYFITPSIWLKNIMGNSFLSEEKVEVIHNGVKLLNLKYDNNELKKIYNINIEKKLILCSAANLNSDIKGIDYLIKALNNLRNKSQIGILLVGKHTHEVVAKLNREYAVYEMGYVYDECVMEQINKMADLYVFPSLLENYSYALLEAMAAGTPVVGFDVGGNSEIINSKRGILVESTNIIEMSNAIEKIIFDDELRKEMSKNCIEFAQFHTEERMVEEYIKLYRKIKL